MSVALVTLKSWFASRLNLLQNKDIEKLQKLYAFYFWAKGKYENGDLTVKSMLEWNEEFRKYLKGEY